MKILDLVDDVRSGCKSVLTTMTLEEYKKLSFFAFNNNGNIDGQRSVITFFYSGENSKAYGG